MGKAIIKSGGTGGQYVVDEVYDNTWGKEEYLTLTSENSALNTQKTGYNTLITSIDGQISTVLSELTAAILAKQDTRAIVSEYNDLIRWLRETQYKLNVVQSRLNNNNFKLQHLSSADVVYNEVVGWSADLNESLSASQVVGIVDRRRRDQPHSFVTIKPTFVGGGTTGYTYNSTNDGVLVSKHGQSAAAWAYNYMMSDGADTWEPRYVYASIYSMNTSAGTCVCKVESFFTQSVAPLGDIYINCTFDYMDCGIDAFAVDDLVVVDVSTSGSYKVIGFQTNPKSCESITVENVILTIGLNAQGSAETGYTIYANHSGKSSNCPNLRIFWQYPEESFWCTFLRRHSYTYPLLTTSPGRVFWDFTWSVNDASNCIVDLVIEVQDDGGGNPSYHNVTDDIKDLFYGVQKPYPNTSEDHPLSIIAGSGVYSTTWTCSMKISSGQTL